MRRVALLLLSFSLAASACRPGQEASADPSLVAASQDRNALAVHEALEELIAAGQASSEDRAFAHHQVQGWDDGSASYAFARAALAGRLAEERGLSALGLIRETEDWGIESIKREPEFQRGAAQRLLGTLYVLAGDHIEHGDSEAGLELLEGLVERYPEDIVNHLRLAEGFVALGDPEGGFEALCQAIGGRSQLTKEEDGLLSRLVAELGGEETLGCAPAS